MEFLKKLIEIPGASSDEGAISNFLLNYIEKEKGNWQTVPTVYSGEKFQDAIVLVFGKPTTILLSHIDTIGFSVGYGKNLIQIGGPAIQDGIQLVGADALGEIETELMVTEDLEGDRVLQYVFDREIERGTILTYKPNFRETDDFIQSPYMDNRLGVWTALKVAQSLENGIIVFSTYEEHGGNTVGPICRFLQDKYNVYQAIVADITWVTDGVLHHGGVAISMRDSGLPRKSYLNKIIALAKESGVKYQLEVESAGGSDGTTIQKSGLLMDWCFIGAAEDHVHSPNEIVSKFDIMTMVELLKYLMAKL